MKIEVMMPSSPKIGGTLPLELSENYG